MAGKKLKTQVISVSNFLTHYPAPPVGSTLGPHGINLMQFCKEFNDKTSSMQGMVPAVVSIYEDRSFDFVIKTPPVAELIKQTLNIKGAGNPKKDVAGTLTQAQLREIAEKKMPDLQSYDVEAAMKQVAGTCRSMGVKIAE